MVRLLQLLKPVGGCSELVVTERMYPIPRVRKSLTLLESLALPTYKKGSTSVGGSFSKRSELCAGDDSTFGEIGVNVGNKNDGWLLDRDMVVPILRFFVLLQLSQSSG